MQGLATFGLWNDWVIITLMMTGLYIVIARDNLVKKVMGLNIFQAAAILYYVSMANVRGGTAPILVEGESAIYSNPLPHVLMLTAIVVGIALTSVALALAVRIHQEYGCTEEDEIVRLDLGSSGAPASATTHPTAESP